MKQIFPEDEYKLQPAPEEHPVWRAKHLLTPEVYPLWGIEHGCRTVVIYSPKDLSCYWNQAERCPTNPAVILATKVGQNVIDYATGRELPADKLIVREVHNFKAAPAKRGALRIAKLRHAGDWNIAPLAVPNLMDALRKPPLSFDVVVNHKELFPGDPNLIYYPLVYIHGRAALSLRQGGPRRAAAAHRAGRRHPLRRRRLRQPRLRRRLPPVRRRAPARQSPGPHPPRRRALLHQGRLRPHGLPVHQGRRRRQGLSPARGRQDQRPLGGHLLQVRHRLRPRAALRARLQGLHLRVGPQDRRQHRHLLHAALRR